MKALRRLLATACLASLLAPAALTAGQTVGTATGSVAGTVTDRTGAIVPGVAITISGEALMGSMSTATGPEGHFRFTALPPGEYTLVFTRDGFRSLTHEGIRLALGFSATINETLDVTGLEDTLTVRPASPVVDAQSTSITTTFVADQLANLPGARSMPAILSATPAVQVGRFDVGGSSGVIGTPYSAYGVSGYNRPMLEGINISGVAGSGFTLDFGSLEEVSVGTAAYGPEWAVHGVRMQFITKSGGNRYRGTLHADYEYRDWQAFNIDDEQIALGAQGGKGISPSESNRLWSYRDLNADIGGFIERDRLWWYASFRDQDVSARYVNFPVKPHRTRVTNYGGKVTYQLAPNHKLVAFGQFGQNFQPYRLDSFGGRPNLTAAIFATENATSEQRALGWVWKGEWNAVFNDALFLEVRVGQFASNLPARPNGTGPRFEDIDTLVVEGRNRHWQQNWRNGQLHASMSYFDDTRLGSHHLKLGGESLRITSSEIWHQAYPGDVLHILQGGGAREVYLFETPSASVNGLSTASAYANDTWRVHDRLTMNLGVRFDRYQVFLPEQTHPVGRFNPTTLTFAAVDNLIDWNVIAPRIGASIDLSGRGTTIAKLSVGRYWLSPTTDVGSNSNPNATQWWRRHRWSDLNLDGQWQEGEETWPPLDSRGGVALESRDPELRLAFVDEAGVWIEHELAAHMALRTGVVWRGAREPFMRQVASRPFEAFTVPKLVADPGPDGVVATSDDGRSIRVYDLPPDVATQQRTFVVKNVPNAAANHVTWEIAVNRRFTGRWSMMAGYAQTWSGDQASGYGGQAVRNNAYPVTPNDLINAAADGQYEFTTWTAKVHATYDGPWGVRLSPLIRHQSGQPFGRTFLTSPNALIYDRVRILAEPLGTRRMDNVTLVDVRVEKAFRLPGIRRIAAFLDIYNLFNANPAQNISWLSGPTFLRPLNIVPPRIARVGVKLEW